MLLQRKRKLVSRKIRQARRLTLESLEDRRLLAVITVDDDGPADYSTIQAAITAAAAFDTISVFAGTYNEDVNVNKTLSVVGAGASATNIIGQIGGDGATVRISANNVIVSGFTITRDGNTVADWNNPGLNAAGVAIIGTALSGMNIHDNIITGNRSGIDVNNSSGHTIRNNVIDDNHTGVIFRNQTDNLTVVENEITDNRTVGVLFLDASGGTNVPVQTALNSSFSNNNISGNWYGQIVDRQSGGLLPAPGTTNLKNFSGNWLGTASPVITTANSAEPGYAGHIPVAYGGTATAPGGQPDVAGPASANFDITPLLSTGTDTNVETTPGRGTFGFQGDFSDVTVTIAGSQTGATPRIQEGIVGTTANGTVNVTAGTFNERVVLDKIGVQVIGAGIDSTIIDHSGTSGPWNSGVQLRGNNVELRNLTVTGNSLSSAPRYGIKADFNTTNVSPVDGVIVDTVKVTNSFRTGLDLNGVTNVTVNNLFAINNGGAGIFMTDVKDASLSNITTSGNPWVGVSIATLGQFFPIGTSDVVFSGTNSFAESGVANGFGQLNGGLQLEMGNFAMPASPAAISWSSNPADGANVTIQSADFGYAVSGQSFDNPNVYVRFYQTLGQAKDAALGTPDHINAGSRYIQEADDSNGLPNSGSTAFFVFDNPGTNKMSIQSAVEAAVGGDLIHVTAGTYDESVNTTAKALTLSLDLADGSSGISTATIDGNVTLNGDDTLALQFTDTTNDQLVINGMVTLGGATLSATSTASLPPADYTIITNDLADNVSGTFAGLPQNATLLLNGAPYAISYTGGTGNDVTLAFAPNANVYVSGSTLIIGGTGDKDHIDVKEKNGELDVKVRSKTFDFDGTFAGITAIVVYGYAGDDDIELHKDVTARAFIFGGEGKDKIEGGGGNSVLVGGAGDDDLKGGDGRNVLIGGTGGDKLEGKDGEDILIGGSTSYDNDLAALDAILAQWEANSLYDTRVAGLSGSGTLNTSTVFDDGESDDLKGGKGLDWLFANTDDADKKKRDKVKDLDMGEVLIEI